MKIEADLEGEPVVDATAKAKPLRLEGRARQERALMRKFGLDETALTEEEAGKRRRGAEDAHPDGQDARLPDAPRNQPRHLPEKLVDHEILEAIVSMLNDMGIVYKQGARWRRC